MRLVISEAMHAPFHHLLLQLFKRERIEVMLLVYQISQTSLMINHLTVFEAVRVA